MIKTIIVLAILIALVAVGAKLYSDTFLLTTGLAPQQVETYTNAEEKALDIKDKMEKQYAPTTLPNGYH